MPLLGAVLLVVQFSFAFHALKTGRPYWWIFIIMGFPVMGCLIYYLVEVFPNSREHRSARKTARKIVRVLQPDVALKARAEELAICGSVDNKIALARECEEHQMFEEAYSLYESAATGPFAADANLLAGMARTALGLERWDAARSALDRLKIASPAHAANQNTRLFEARLLAGRGETDAAIAAFRALLPEFVGLEARYRYGELLLDLGQQQAATQMFDELIQHAKRFASSVDEEQQWVSAARRAIANG